ncbi:MAG: hypothetical protein E6Q34_02365, partial [Burkholderiaceae bacterium]
MQHQSYNFCRDYIAVSIYYWLQQREPNGDRARRFRSAAQLSKDFKIPAGFLTVSLEFLLKANLVEKKNSDRFRIRKISNAFLSEFDFSEIYRINHTLLYRDGMDEADKKIVELFVLLKKQNDCPVIQCVRSAIAFAMMAGLAGSGRGVDRNFVDVYIDEALQFLATLGIVDTSGELTDTGKSLVNDKFVLKETITYVSQTASLAQLHFEQPPGIT